MHHTSLILSLLFIFLLITVSRKEEPFIVNQQIVDDNRLKHRCVADITLQAVNSYPRNSIDFLGESIFRPECCPSTYTTSSGCLCMFARENELLWTRGGNRIIIPPF
jgi:hypothetical protein